MIEFGERVYNLRTKLKITQEELAKQLKTSKRSVCAWEKNKAFPRAVSVGRFEAMERNASIPNVIKIDHTHEAIVKHIAIQNSYRTARKILTEQLEILDILVRRCDETIENLIKGK